MPVSYVSNTNSPFATDESLKVNARAECAMNGKFSILHEAAEAECSLKNFEFFVRQHVNRFAQEDGIQSNHSCATILISHKQLLPKKFAVVKLDLKAPFERH